MVDRGTPPKAYRWQDKYAQPDWQSKLTKLSPSNEMAFQIWSAMNGAPDTPDYDMRGFYQKHVDTQVNQNDGKPHYTDEFKTPLHESFSAQSRYAKKDAPDWNQKDQLIGKDGEVMFDEPKAYQARNVIDILSHMVGGQIEADKSRGPTQ